MLSEFSCVAIGWLHMLLRHLVASRLVGTLDIRHEKQQESHWSGEHQDVIRRPLSCEVPLRQLRTAVPSSIDDAASYTCFCSDFERSGGGQQGTIIGNGGKERGKGSRL